MSDYDDRLIIYEDSFFSLCYTLHYNGNLDTNLSHRCDTDGDYTWDWRWSIWNECELCGIDIPANLIRTWRMFLMLDEVGIDADFVRKVYQSTTEEEIDLYYWRKIRYA